MLEAIRAEDRDYRCGVSRLGEESARLLAVSRVGAGEAVVFYRAHILEKCCSDAIDAVSPDWTAANRLLTTRRSNSLA
jgi:hypothetical protein